MNRFSNDCINGCARIYQTFIKRLRDSKVKPILYHDIDGVLFGDYAGEFQLRPGLKTWLKWVNDHFDVVFLTMWRHEEIDTLLSVLMVEKYMKSLHSPGFRSANWRSSYEDKELWVVDAVAKTGMREWFWIDDEIPNLERLQHLALDPGRCLKVNSKGAGELEGLKTTLLELLKRRAA